MDFSKYLRSLAREKHIATILRASRKQRDFSQSESAFFLGFSKQKYDRWEQGLDTPAFLDWAQICERHQLDLDLGRTGALDSGLPIQIRNTSETGGFKLPERYSSWQAVSNRWIIPIVEHLKFRMGEKKFLNFCEKKELDAYYFYCEDQLVNFELIHDLIEELLKYTPKSNLAFDAREAIKTAFEKGRQSSILEVFDSHHPHKSIIYDLNKLNKHFDLIYQYKTVEILPDGYYICAAVSDWAREQVEFNPDVKSWYHQYKMEWIKRLLETTGQLNVRAEMLQLDDKRDPDCLFRIQVG